MTHVYNRIGQQLGSYHLVQLLGEGGFAEVYLGQHLFLPRQAAIKILKVQVGQAEHQVFLQEAQTITTLDHPHIIQILDFGIDREIPFLVMAYALGGSLRTRFPSGPYALSDFLPYVEQIAQALDYAHLRKVVHRDIKPDNILLKEQNQALLSDFGISVIMSHTISQRTLDIIGTPAYMSPEQFSGRPQPASDQYSMGVIVYQLLCGQRPFQGDFAALGYQHMHEPPPPLHTLVQGISLQTERVVLKALAKDPGERYDSVTTFAQALKRSLSSASSTIFVTPRVITSGMPFVPTHVTAAIYDTPTEPNPHLEPITKTITISQTYSSTQSEARKNRAEECFICAYKRQLRDAQHHIPCDKMHISGYIVGLLHTSTIVVAVDRTDERASVTLDSDYYGTFIRLLRERGKSILKQPITFYHLSKYRGQTLSNGKICHQYVGDAYTLAVLEPDMLLNITSVSEADYCHRKYLLNRLVASSPSLHTILGNIVHTCFTALLKEGQTTDDGRISEHLRQKTVLQILQDHCEKALALKTFDISLANVSLVELREEIQPHLEHLANWYQANSNTVWGDTNNVRAETTLLAPEIGMRGRLDLHWQQASGQSLLELKTGGASGNIPKGDHRKQVHGYQSLLMVHDNVRLTKASTQLVYSGTPGQASAIGIPFDIRNVQRLNEIRNILVLSRITGVPPTPPGGKRCEKCSIQASCIRVSHMLGWQPPLIDRRGDVLPTTDAHLSFPPFQQRNQQQIDNENSQFFKHYYDLLQLEGRAGEKDLERLWKIEVKDRIDAGKAIDKLKSMGEPVASKDGWKQEFECENYSELREGDEILLSDGDPIHGNIVTGTILSIKANSVTVWMRERIEKPSLLDVYDNDLVHIRTQKNLLRWLDSDPHLQNLVMGSVLPRFSNTSIDVRERFNVEQREAIRRALQMQDYLLIQGPPGTGKTTVIAEIVRRLVARGERVLLAAFTNQAVDTMLQSLQKEGIQDFIRIGHERSVDDAVKSQLLTQLFEEEYQDHGTSTNTIYDLLHSTPIVASTTATWSSEEYIQAGTANAPSSSLSFDVAIIDEASQLTVPALLGALRFVKRFILVGDEKQLPPLVLSEDAKKQGLDQSLFCRLQSLPQATNYSVMLKTQYRMNQVISRFPSTVFYNGELVPHESVASRRLELNEPKPVMNTLKNITPEKIMIAEQEKPIIRQVIHPWYPLVFLNTHDVIYSSQQKSSLTEAKAVQEIVEALLKRGVKAQNIGVIAPYRAQVARIRRLLAQKNSDELPCSSVFVNTVDRFQGGECEVIIISFATPSTPTGTRLEFLTNPHRLNVALTRAKTKLILVGYVPALEHLPIFSRLLAYCRSMTSVYSYESSE